ncbi:hypothetical protein PR048_032448 [Dryococelus australis]|uniref:Uncharacterized protein n=1 Tax=Dryococelus australis TaxID=614101 RepID=A0ABQ9G280_9NEOP|nr:hypothetical protein PR048_032448 [Dryococelus australis]
MLIPIRVPAVMLVGRPCRDLQANLTCSLPFVDFTQLDRNNAKMKGRGKREIPEKSASGPAGYLNLFALVGGNQANRSSSVQSRLAQSHPGKLGSIIGEVGIVKVFSGIYRFLVPCIPALLYLHLALQDRDAYRDRRDGNSSVMVAVEHPPNIGAAARRQERLVKAPCTRQFPSENTGSTRSRPRRRSVWTRQARTPINSGRFCSIGSATPMNVEVSLKKFKEAAQKITPTRCYVYLAGWLDYSPPSQANRILFPAGSLPDFRVRELCRTIPLAGGRVFLGISSFPTLLHYGAAPCTPRFTLIGSQDLDVRSRPKLFALPLILRSAHFLWRLRLHLTTGPEEQMRVSRGEYGVAPERKNARGEMEDPRENLPTTDQMSVNGHVRMPGRETNRHLKSLLVHIGEWFCDNATNVYASEYADVAFDYGYRDVNGRGATAEYPGGGLEEVGQSHGRRAPQTSPRWTFFLWGCLESRVYSGRRSDTRYFSFTVAVEQAFSVSSPEMYVTKPKFIRAVRSCVLQHVAYYQDVLVESTGQKSNVPDPIRAV